MPAAQEQFEAWNQRQDASALTDLRRSFHTLKGGARMLNASSIGELSWAFENLLNQIDSGLIAVSTEIQEAIVSALSHYPQLVNELREGKASVESETTAELRQKAEQLAGATVSITKAEAAPISETPAPSEPQQIQAKALEPLHKLMSDGLKGLLQCDNIFSDWAQHPISQERLNLALADLEGLEKTAESCNVQELQILSEAIFAALSSQPTTATLNEASYSLFRQGCELLMSMFDAVASNRVLPSAPEIYLASLHALATNTTEQTNQDIEQSSHITEAEPKDPETELLESSDDISVPNDFLNKSSTSLVDDDFQEELIETFLEEAEDLLNEISAILSGWQSTPSDFSYADQLHRTLHTLKGGARLSGMETLGSASHDFESFSLDHQVSRDSSPAFFEQALVRYDALVEIVERTRAGEFISPNPIQEDESTDQSSTESIQISPIEDTIGNNELIEQNISSDTPDSPSEVTESKVEIEANFDTPDISIQETVQDSTEANPGREATDNRAEVVRLKAPDLDNIINLSGESTVFRTRIEAEVNDSVGTITELENTIDRIQTLARRLDVETQAQILFRKEQIAESDSPEDFDPLEMDRYSLLQQLSHQLNESSSDLKDLRSTLTNTNSETLSLLTQTSRLQSELNDRLLKTRMVPFGRLMPRLQRMTRQISGELDKKVQLHTGALEGELDRNVLDQILPALEHVLRNAIDHGIEPANERAEKGKEAVGRIGIEVQRDGAQVVIKIADDGKGIDLDKVTQNAIDKGLIDKAQGDAMQEAEIADLIFMPGFSTADSLTQISGRGVGMDIVRSIISQLGGTVEVGSKSGVGSTFFLRIPFTLSVNRALMINIGNNHYALPLSSLEALARVPVAELDSYYEDDNKYLSYGNHQYKVMYLGEILRTAERPRTETLTDRTVPLALFRSGEFAIAAQVDEIQGSQEIVVKSLSHPFNKVPGLSGAAIMGDGTLVVTLDMFTLMSRSEASGLNAQSEIEKREIAEDVETSILVVDDSVTVRKVTSRFLKREGFAVSLARDGVEALRMVNEHPPNLMIVDVEMPNMDGFELIEILQSTEKFQHIPVILITSRTGEKHRQKGLSLGAKRYFGKPYREDEILLAINELMPQ